LFDSLEKLIGGFGEVVGVGEAASLFELVFVRDDPGVFFDEDSLDGGRAGRKDRALWRSFGGFGDLVPVLQAVWPVLIWVQAGLF